MRLAPDDLCGGPSPLRAVAGQIAVVKLLLSAGADANVVNDARCQALHYHKGRVGVVEALLPCTAAIDARDKYGATALARSVPCTATALTDSVAL